MKFQPKDFIESREGLIFAVMDFELEAGRVLCFLRYRREPRGFQKMSTDEANQFLRDRYPEFLFHSTRCDAHLHGVKSDEICVHYQPRQRVTEIVTQSISGGMEETVLEIIKIFADAGLNIEYIGITGSILINAQGEGSDIDLVIYGRDNFMQARKIVSESITADKFQSLTPELWKEAYIRRSPSLSEDEYIWHERRKFNKALCRNIKFDISLLDESVQISNGKYQKQGPAIIDAKVTCDRYAFDFPARYRLNHGEIDEAVCFTPTYAGQAFKGETIRVSGQIESSVDHRCRIVVGSTREAPGEYIKVVSTA